MKDEKKTKKVVAEMKVEVKKAAPPRPPKLTPVATPDEVVIPTIKTGVIYLFEGKSGSAFMASVNEPKPEDKFTKLTIHEVLNNCISERVIDVPDITVYKTRELTETEIAYRMAGINGDSNG